MGAGCDRIIGVRTLGAGRWLRLVEMDYLDAAGDCRRWEAAQRRGDQGAVMVVATLRPSGRVLLVRQFRPPVECHVIEFPAGLIDGDETPEAAAVRELREETGFAGIAAGVGPRSYNTPGLTGEFVHLVQVDVDETAAANRFPSPAPAVGEHVEAFALVPEAVTALLRARLAAGDGVDSKVIAWLAGRGEAL